MGYLLDRRQFTVAQLPVMVDETWKSRDLADGWVLSYQGDLAVSEGRGPDGRSVLLLGAVVRDRPLDTAGSGRYAMLDWPHVSTDRGAGTLSVFYGSDASTRVVSSSARLAAAVLRGGPADRNGIPVQPRPDYQHVLKHPSLMNYVPSPGSRYRDVRRLMRDQRLNFLTGAVEHVPGPLAPAESYEGAVQTVAEELTRFAVELRERSPGRIHLQLTAGIDSRTLLAAFCAAGVAFETVTFRTPFKPDEDASVAQALSRGVGVSHRVIEVQAPPDPGAGQTYLMQTSGGINGADLKALFPGNTYRFLEAGDAMVGGLGFEVGRQKFREHFVGLNLETATGAELWRRLVGEPDCPDFARFLDEWLQWRRQHPYPFGAVASYYIDQRLGAWASTQMSGFDLLPGATIHPAASARIMAALLSPPMQDQIDGRLQHDVIGRLAPGLARYPLNPVPLKRRVRSMISRARRAARRVF